MVQLDCGLAPTVGAGGPSPLTGCGIMFLSHEIAPLNRPVGFQPTQAALSFNYFVFS